MNRILIACVTWLALSGSIAHALPRNPPPAPIHIAFGDCAGFGTSDVTNACNTNSGAIVIVGSFNPPVGISDGVGMEAFVDISQASVLSDWWRLDPAGCRIGRLSANFVFADPLTNCVDPWQVSALGNVGMIYPGQVSTPANGERLDVYCAVDASTPMQFIVAQEYYLFELIISRGLTVGGCGGCDVPTTLCMNQLLMAREPGSGDLVYSSDGSYQCLSYDSNTPTPARRSSWGSIKTLYR